MLLSRAQIYGYQLKKELLKSKYAATIAENLLSSFDTAIKKISSDIDEEKFLEYIEFNYNSLDKVCFFIIVNQFGNTVLDKDPLFISELCSALINHNIVPQNYHKFINFFISEPIYSLIMKLNEDAHSFGYITLFDIIMNKFDIENLTKSEKTKILKTLYTLTKQEYHLLFESNYNLLDMYNALYNKMLDINKEQFVFYPQDFNDLFLLKKYSIYYDDNIKDIILHDLQTCEEENYDLIIFIKSCLEIIRNHCQKILPFQLIREKNRVGGSD